MSALVLGNTYPVARIPHECMDCGRVIEPGEKYNRQRIVSDDRAYVWKDCDQCAKLAERLWAEGDYIESDGLYLPDVDWRDVMCWSDEWALLARGFLRKWRNDDGSLIELPRTATVS